MASWLKALKRGTISITPTENFDDITTAIKNADSGIPSINDAFKNLNYSQVGDELYAGNARWRDVEPKLRKGKLLEAFDDMQVPTTLTLSDEANIKKLIKPSSPDIKIDELDTKIDSAKAFHDDIDIEPGRNGDELESKLDRKQKEKITTFYSSLKKAVGTGAIGAGLFAFLLFSDNMWDDLANAANSRNGCYLVSTVAGATVACKILARSCGYGMEGMEFCSGTEITNLDYNIYYMAHDILLNDADAVTDLNTKYGIVLTADTIDAVLQSPENIQILVDYYKTYYNNNEAFDPCTLAGTVSEDCVSCHTSAMTNSRQYVNGDLVEGNVTFQCIKNSSVLDVLVDVATGIGVDIFDTIGDSISGSVQNNFFVFIIITVIIIIAGAIFFKSRNNNPQNIQPVAIPTPVASTSYNPPPPQTYQANNMQRPAQFESQADGNRIYNSNNQQSEVFFY